MISKGGAILLGKSVACDGFAEREVRVVTHAHSDHLIGLEKSLKYGKVIATPATAELIRIFRGRDVRVLDYGKRMDLREGYLELFDAGHIIGSAQVLVVDEDGRRWVYTGDFRIEKVQVVKSDLLVIEATYGNPSNVRKFDAEEAMLKLIESLVKLSKTIHIFGYHGKLQEVAELLKDFELYMDPSVYKVAKICEKHGMKFGEFALRGKENKGIFLHHMNLAKRIRGGTRIYLSGWEFEKPVRRLSENEYIVALSDHSDFEGLIKYVELSDPELVITDNFRVGDAPALAREIRNRLGIRAVPMP